MKVILNAVQAGRLFDILVKDGNHENREYAYTLYRKEEFIETCALGISEHWYSTNAGSSMKVYFDGFREQPVWAFAQTFNPAKEKTLVEDLNKALVDFVAEVRSELAADANEAVAVETV